jgi:hypothetical protein
MNCAKFPEPNEAPDGLRVFGIILSRLKLGTIWIRLPGAPERGLEDLSSGRHNKPIETRHRNRR